MTTLLQYITNGLVDGSTYALMGLGLAIIFGLMNVVNFAHGTLYALGAYIGYTVMHVSGLGFVSALLGAAVGAGLVGMAIERFLLEGARKKSPLMMPMLITIGLWFALENLIIIIWGPQIRTLDSGVPNSAISIGPVYVQSEQALVVGTALALVIATHLWLKLSRTGVAMRASFQEPDAARLCGISVRRSHAIGFGIGSALAAMAGTLVGSVFALSPTMGGLATAQAFAIVILGGLGSFSGTILAALIIGVAESLTVGYVSAGYAPAVSLAILLLILNLRPQGLMGRRVEVAG